MGGFTQLAGVDIPKVTPATAGTARAIAALGTDTPKRGRFEGMRGPNPPYRVCPECGEMSETPWENPVLNYFKQHGYTGETTGGAVVCETCWPKVDARFKKLGKNGEGRVVIGLPVEWKDATLDNYKRSEFNDEALKAARAFVRGGDTDLYLCGPVGTGKTRLACSIANAVRKAGTTAMFVRVPVLIAKLIAAQHSEMTDEATVFDYVSPGLLVLDDLGVEKGSDYTRRVLQTLYDLRRDAGRRTIFTSNGDLQQLSDYLEDDRLPSRIAGYADVIYIGGEDFRLTLAADRQRERMARRFNGRNFREE